MIKIAHESPISIFDTVQQHTDIDYALVHLFEESPAYLSKFMEAKAKGREVILDNSIFELGKAFDAEKFAGWIYHTNPTWYIIPDSLEDKDGTIYNAHQWEKKYGDLPGRKIGVVQGTSYKEIVECYKAIEPLVDMVGISFDYSFFERWYPGAKTKYHAWMEGRRELLFRLNKDGVINTNKPHHLLGCSLPQEFKTYKEFYPWIYSIDTSNPVVHGLLNILYAGFGGLDNKESIKLFTLIDSDVSEEQLHAIRFNISYFADIVNG